LIERTGSESRIGFPAGIAVKAKGAVSGITTCGVGNKRKGAHRSVLIATNCLG
jgi:hypothetical protein